jgi:hypothetical protein
MRPFLLVYGLLALITIALAGCGGSSSSSSSASSNTPVLQSITVSPASASITIGATQPFTATGHYSDSSTQNLTSSATWSSSVPADATIAVGLAKGVAAGSTNITASVGTMTSSPAAVLAVTAAPTAVLQSITVSPASASITIGATQPFTATGHYSDSSTQNLTSSASWTSSVPADATIAAGLAEGVAAGSTNITATVGTMTSSPAAVLTVTAAVTGSGSTFYVSTVGSDSNPGTLASPWLTIQHAASTVQAGDTVYVLPGVYSESVNIGVSGSAAAGPVTFASYLGQAGVIVDGTGLTPPTSGTQALLNIVNQSYVTIQGFEIRNYTTSNANATPAGIWVTGAGSNIQLLNNLVHNITTTAEASGNAFGVAVYGSSASASIDSITISGNQVYDLKTGNSETVNVDGNVTNFTISNNIIHDNDNIGIDAIGFEGVAPSPSVDFARNGEISGNTIYNISAINNPGEGNQYDADGIYCDGCSNVVIERNLVYACDLNIEAASEHSGHSAQYVTIRNNVVYNANSVGISIGGYASSVGGSQYVAIVNNTLFENDTKNTGSGEVQVQYYATNNVFENNVVYATSQGLFLNDYTNSEPDPVNVDHNLYFSSVSSSSAEFLWNGTDYNGFSSYQLATAEDPNSQYANPLFVSVTTPSLQVQAGSPVINAGSTLSTLTCSTMTGETGDYWGCPLVGAVDFLGNPREQGSNIDIGAYEQ